ncbi:5'-3' exonuclease H3TH domain-containing protein [Castellaniella sp.]|uniref:5'-3' exonuclease H3TH domain-containing protein n=1 Tax=Castellaniella sp. TaxID=1955812 RepID=UPI002AFEF0A7|nr:5'-3' exonuclease H3TH domain-containing protein [Castellaniella sp.]
MANTIIVDASNRVHAHHSVNVLTVGKFQVQAIFGFVREVHALVERNPGWSPLVLWDGHAQWRYDVFPEYKSGREEKAKNDPEAADRRRSREAQIPYIRKALSWMGIHQMYSVSQEADDMAGYFAKRIPADGSLVRLVSSDTDWSQLVGTNVQWVDTINDKKLTPTNFFEMTGYRDGFAYIQGKALIGDTSDSIDGIPKIGKKTAPLILAEFGSVAEFFRQVDAGIFIPKKVAHKNLAYPVGRHIFERNMKIMNLLDAPAPPKGDARVIAPDFNPQNLRLLFDKLNFQSILRDFDDWIEPLQKRQGKA